MLTALQYVRVEAAALFIYVNSFNVKLCKLYNSYITRRRKQKQENVRSPPEVVDLLTLAS